MPHAKVKPEHRKRAKQLRQTMTRAETLLWRYIKAKRIDELGFRRQMPLGKYVLDFVCLSAKLVIELDGQSHDFAARQISDKARDEFLNSEGFTVLRFTNDEVMSNLAGVVGVIRSAAFSCRTSPPSLPLPHKGGGNGGELACHNSAVEVLRGPQP
jgi:very-short-patch-repair endonuclease